MEAPQKWVCKECGCVMAEPLFAPNPFDPSDTVSGCPECKSVNAIEVGCQVGDCRKIASGGHPGGHGFRYIWTCWDHRPNTSETASPE